MSDDGIKTGKSTSKGKNKAGSKKELKPAQVEVELVEQTAENGETQVDVLSEVAMSNAYLICHNVQDLMYFRGFYWEGAEKKGKGKKKKR